MVDSRPPRKAHTAATPTEAMPEQTASAPGAPCEGRSAFDRIVLGAPGAVLLGLLLCLYVAMLDRHGYWYDELMTLFAVRLPFREMVEERLAAGHPPGYFSLTWLWARIAGEREAALRLPTLLYVLGSAALLHRIVGRLVDARSARLALLLFLLGPFELGMAHVARPYALVQLMALALTALVLQAEERPTRRDPFLVGALACALLATHYSALLLLPGVLVYLLFRHPQGGRLSAALVAGAALAAPFAVVTARLRTPLGAIEWLGDPALASFLEILAEQTTNLEWQIQHPWLGPVTAVPLVAGAALGARVLGSRGWILVAGWLGPLVAGLIAEAFGAPNILGVSRYWVGPLAHQTGLLAVGLAALARRRPAVGALAVALVAGTALAGSLTTARHDHPPDWRALARTVEDQRRPREPIAVDLDAPRWTLWQHYVPTDCYDLAALDAGLRPRLHAGATSPHALGQQAAPRPLRDAPSVLVYFRARPQGEAARWLGTLQRYFPHRSELQAPVGTLWRLSRKAEP